MNQLFPLPVYSLVKIIVENGGVAPKKIKNLASWFTKTILFEPIRWIELARYNKKIQQHRITNHPVFVLGFYRSGTSYLHQLLTKDDRLGYHSNFQMVLPEIMLTTEKVLLPVFEFVSRTLKLKDSVHRVPLSFRFPGEEDATMTTSGNPKGVQWGYFFPNKMNEVFEKYVLFENITDAELEGWKTDFIFLLNKISLANHGKQLVLKSPPNTARIKLLLSLFPHAKFIFIHRNPYEVYLSNQQFWKVTQRIFALGAATPAAINSIILDTYAKMMHRFLLQKELVPKGQLVEIGYDEFIEQPLESMRKIYERIQLGDFNYCEQKLKSFIDGQKSFVRLKHEIPAAEKKIVAEKWGPFISHWNYPL